MSDTQRALPRPGQLGMRWEMQLMPLVQNLPGRVTNTAHSTHTPFPKADLLLSWTAMT